MPAPKRATLVALIVLTAPSVLAAPTLSVKLPKVVQQSDQYRLQVLEDGTARLPLQWSETSTPSPKLSIALSAFEAKDHPMVNVGLKLPGQADFARSLQDVELGANGTELLLSGMSLSPDVEYMGELSAAYLGPSGSLDTGQSLLWKITLLRPRALAPFSCPAGLQIASSDGSTSIEFARTGPADDLSLGLRLSPFVSNQQEVAQIGFQEGNAPSSHLSLQTNVNSTKSNSFIPPIRTAELAEGVTYSGKLWFSIANREVLVCPLDILMPKRAKGQLALDAQTLSRNITLPVLGSFGEEAPRLSVRLFDKDRTHRIEGLSAVLDGVTTSPDGSFELADHVTFWLDRQKAENFTSWKRNENSVGRSLEAGQQLEVGMSFAHLEAGAYEYSLKFQGSNTAAEAPKLSVSLNVRHHWLWAVLVELGALALSFFFSKGIASWRERIRLRNQVSQMREAVQGIHTDLPGLVFLRAVLAQTLKVLDHQWILPPPPSVYDFLARAQRVVVILTRYREVHAAVKRAAMPETVRNYYYRSISQVLNQIGATPLDQKTADAVVADLNTIATNLSDPLVGYWNNLRPLASALAMEAKIVERSLGDEAIVGPLLSLIASPPSAFDARVDSAYWLVQLLYTRRAIAEDIAKLIDAYRPKAELSAVFKVADELVWMRLTDAVKANAVSVQSTEPSSTLECLRPLKFILKFNDPVLADSFFIHNLTKYSWRLKFSAETRARPWKWKSASPRSYEPAPIESSGPRVTQYAPFPGNVAVGATIHWGERTLDVPPPSDAGAGRASVNFRVTENSELSALKNFDRSELVLLGVVTAVALATGLPALYFSKATFGSFGDYIGILVWAIGVDQSKNLIQLMKSYPADPATNAATPSTS